MISAVKKIVPVILIAGSLIVITVSPASYKMILLKAKTHAVDVSRVETYEYNLLTMKQSVVTAAQEFDAARTFDISYTDVDRILQVLAAVDGIEVRSTYSVDPLLGYQDVAIYNSGDVTQAVRFDMLVDDVRTALDVFDKMELAVADYAFTAPNGLSITILTGGVV